jgi:hypothetical protein
MLRFLIFMISVMAISTSMAATDLPCSIDTIPIQIIGERGSSSEFTISTGKFRAKQVGGADPQFIAFVTSITGHITNRLGKKNLCLSSDESKKDSLLQFMHWYFRVGNGSPAPILRLDMHTSDSCRITSPWIDIFFEQKPVPKIRAIIRWNERQLLADQAVLAGVQNIPPGVAQPLAKSELGYFTKEYKKTGGSPEEHIPPDILWLFRLSDPADGADTIIPFSGVASSTMDKITKRGTKGYTKIITALIDRCLDSKGADIHYDSVLDIADLIPIEEYKIKLPLR